MLCHGTQHLTLVHRTSLNRLTVMHWMELPLSACLIELSVVGWGEGRRMQGRIPPH